jgi:hypothetical protein
VDEEEPDTRYTVDGAVSMKSRICDNDRLTGHGQVWNDKCSAGYKARANKSVPRPRPNVDTAVVAVKNSRTWAAAAETSMDDAACVLGKVLDFIDSLNPVKNLDESFKSMTDKSIAKEGKSTTIKSCSIAKENISSGKESQQQ